ncbi:TonB-dependent receptor [Tenacibaculum holothuriorum]|uniref:TonB-dependent receptor n=1 Tax=Tenacibaculum holothuriorum TaxID=1635173 RepID=A0A1Y2PHH2_9FLAO|nr:SusC/RagA family TonB-linked outer membrane protein [Tenacibaculum holothuriorum]OSY89451.1 TonB-dependent receptor [Tenacibaculum holothuriorum]
MKDFKIFLFSILLLISSQMFAQQTLRGTVIEKSTGQGLPGASVVIKGTTKGTSSDFNGKFELNDVKSGDVLIFTSIGFINKEVTISNSYNITVSLEEDSQLLNEVVVVGYGTTTKKDATGSVESITSKGFTKGNIVTPENLLSGRVSGVSITTSGAPGSGSEIRIRGGSSLSASNSPLIIIDGLPIDNNGTTGSRGVLANINPNDIESFSVLKDASATAIYGSRASNGVIIITTKKGKSTFSFNYDVQYTFGEIKDRINVFSADAFRNIVQQQQPSMINQLGNSDTNWQNEVLRKSVSSLHNLSLRGTIFNTVPFRISAGFTNQEGNIITSDFKRNNASLSLTPSFFEDHLKVNFNVNRVHEFSRFGDSGQLGAALRYDPTHPVYDSSSRFGGFYQHLTTSNGTTIVENGTTNPVAALLQRTNLGQASRTYGNIQLDYKFHFLPELKAVLNLGYDETNGMGTDITTKTVPVTTSNPNFIGNESFSNQKRTNRLLDGYLNYKNNLTKNIIGDFTAGYSYQKFTNEGLNSGNRRDPNSEADPYTDDPLVLIGFFGRANLTFWDKYLVTLNYRRDGTSRFSEANRWGNFGGAAIAWKISEESFLKDSKIISDLKLRASYGTTGQQDIDARGLFLEKYRLGNNNSQYILGGNPITIAIPSAINPDIKWETTSTIEVGVDYGLFNNKFTGAVSAFQKNSTDLLFNDVSVADGSNFSNTITRNIGELQIRGLEFSINGDILKTEDFDWNFNFNGIIFDREIKELALGQDVRTGGIAGGTGNNIQLLREGFAPNSFYVLKQLYNADGTPIEGAYADLNGDNIINDDDRYLKGNPDADIVLGFQSNFNYKNFDLSFNLRANIGNYVYNNVNSARAQFDLLQDNAVLGNIPTSVLNTNFQTTADVITSDIYLEDASFVRMDNITLGYTFNPIKKFSNTSLRIWAGMQNVFIITDYSGLDPEVFGGIDNTIYPRPRNILLGANIKF